MIEAIEGILTKKEPTNCIIKTNVGISYKIFISLTCSSLLEEGKNIELLISQIIREDANLLYGFIEESERKMFQTLIKVSGIGANTAMTTCSSLSSDMFTKALVENNTLAFTKIPGIGPKTAKRIIAELSDSKVIDSIQNQSNSNIEAIMALESLGFKKDKINKILLQCVSKNTADLVKEALKKMI